MCLPAYHGDAREHLGGGCRECGRGCVLRSFGTPPQLGLRIYSVPGQLPVFPARSPPWMNIWSVQQNGGGLRGSNLCRFWGGGTPSPRSQRTFLQVCGRDPARLFGTKVRWGQRGQPQVTRIQGWRRGQVQGWRQLGGWEGEGKACRCTPGDPSSGPPGNKAVPSWGSGIYPCGVIFLSLFSFCRPGMASARRLEPRTFWANTHVEQCTVVRLCYLAG